jgi:hypothetical protein
MCVTCLFGVQTLSLLSTRHVHSFQSIAIEVHNINTLVQDKQYQAMQAIEIGWFNILNFLWFLWWGRYVMNLGLQNMDWEFGWEGQLTGKDWSSKITMKWWNSYAWHKHG